MLCWFPPSLHLLLGHQPIIMRGPPSVHLLVGQINQTSWAVSLLEEMSQNYYCIMTAGVSMAFYRPMEGSREIRKQWLPRQGLWNRTLQTERKLSKFPGLLLHLQPNSGPNSSQVSGNKDSLAHSPTWPLQKIKVANALLEGKTLAWQ